jgi:hypothetical protein
MTLLIGVNCTDGVVIGSDSAATYSTRDRATVEQPVRKLFLFDGRIITATTGPVGLGQRFRKIVGNVGDVFDTPDPGSSSPPDAIEVGKRISRRTQKDFMDTLMNRPDTKASLDDLGALVALSSDGGTELAEFAEATLQPELKNADAGYFATLGSGQSIAGSD